MEDQKTDRRADRSKVRVEAVRKQLEHLVKEGDCELILVHDETGLVLERAQGEGDDHEHDVTAFHHVLVGFRALLANHLSLHTPDEVSVVSMAGHRMVCRFFEHADSKLSVLFVKRGKRPDRELVDRAVSGVQRILTAIDA